MRANIRKPRRRPSAATSAGSVPNSFRSRSRHAVRAMGPGQISQPIPVPGGVSIIAVQDTRKILTADPRDAVLSLKQVSITFPAGTTRQQAEADRRALRRRPRRTSAAAAAPTRSPPNSTARSCRATRSSCATFRPRFRRSCCRCRSARRPSPFGSIEEGVRMLVICGRDEADPTAPTFDQVYQPAQRGAGEHCAPAAICATCAAMR